MCRLALAVLSLAFLAACQSSVSALSDEDIAAIRNIGTSYTEAAMARDVDAVMTLFDDDAILMPSEEPASVGKDAIRDRFATMFAGEWGPSEYTLTSVEIEGMGATAFDRGTYTWTAIMPDATNSLTVTGKYLAIARRQQDGAWLWFRIIHNLDAPLPAPQ